MLNDVNNWKFLSNLKIYKSNYKYHYKTIYNKFCLWTSLNVFKNAFYNYKTIIYSNLLLIDVVSINNKYGSENIVINVEYKKKKITKLSIISNKINNVLFIQLFLLTLKISILIIENFGGMFPEISPQINS